MTALINILHDLLFQFRLRGGLQHRLACVLSYYNRYGRNRRHGLSQADSRVKALGSIASDGISGREVSIRYPLGMTMTMDAYSASFLTMDLITGRAYSHRPDFLPRAGQTVIDVGGHQGLYTLEAARLVGKNGRVVAFEPDPKNRRLLERNIAANELSQVTVIPMAATDFTGNTTLYTTPLASGGHTITETLRVPGVVFNPIEVQADTLDNVLDRLGIANVDILKIDAEGACLNVLRGAARALQRHPLLLMEVEGGEREIRKVRKHIETLGYKTTQFESILYAAVPTA